MKKQYRVTMQSAAIAKLRTAGTENPGKTAAELAQVLGYSEAHTVVLAGMLHKAGELIPVKGAHNIVRWWPADLVAREIERLQAERHERKKERQRLYRSAKPYSKAERIKMHGPAASRILSLIEANPGITSHKMAEMSGYALSHVKNALCVITGNQKAWPVPVGIRRCWYLYDEAMQRIAEKEKPKRQQEPTHKQRILEMAKRDGGVSSADIMREIKNSLKVVSRNCPALVKAGKLHKSYRLGARARWFDTAARAAAWANMPPMEPNEWVTRGWKEKPSKPEKPQKAPKLVAIGAKIKSKARQPSIAPPLLEGSRKNTPPKALDAPVTLKSKATDMVGAPDLSRARVIVCPSPTHDARYQVAPGAIVLGEFSRQWRELRGQA